MDRQLVLQLVLQRLCVVAAAKLAGSSGCEAGVHLCLRTLFVLAHADGQARLAANHARSIFGGDQEPRTSLLPANEERLLLESLRIAGRLARPQQATVGPAQRVA